MNKASTKKLNGFTLTEVLITLALTSVALTFCYGTFDRVQQLFQQYKLQNRFIEEAASFQQLLTRESRACRKIIKETEHLFRFAGDTSASSLQVLDDGVIFFKSGRRDTFHLKTTNIASEAEPLNNRAWSNKLVTSLRLETAFAKQHFTFFVFKQYEADIKLAIETKD